MNHFYLKAQEAIKEENYSKAIDFLSKAIKEEPNNPDYYSHRGVSYFHLAKFKESMSDMDTSVNLDANYGYRYASRAYIKSSIGDIDGAIADYEKAIALDPEDSVSLNNLGLMQEKLGYERKAKENFEKADKLAKLLENTGVEYQEELKPRNIQKEIEEEKKGLTTPSILKDIITKPSVFKEFVQFIKNGFKS